ncbi:MAG: ribosome hibernation-promoting factor, HPF/YfiA family [Oligoflexus sp.]
MDFQFYFKKMNSSETLKDLAIRKISDRIEKYVNKSSKVRMTFYVDGNMKHVTCGVAAADGDHFHAEGSSENIFNAIDIIAQKLESQFQRRKTRFKNRYKQRWDMEKIESLLNSQKKHRLESDGLDFIDAGDIVKFEAAMKPYRARMMH